MTDLIKILTYEDVAPVPIDDNGEPMVVVQQEAPDVICRYENDDMQQYLGDLMIVREGVARRLRQAATLLEQRSPGTKIRLVYGYRHPKVQSGYFKSMSERLALENPDLSSAELLKLTHQFVAVPDVAGHPTGAAIDVTLERDGTDLDMGSQILCFDQPELVPTFSEGVSKPVLENRELLREVLLASEFAPFNGEWWHFSYGDREWAAFYEKPCALYGPIDYSV